MKRTMVFTVAAFVAALAMGAMAGCGGQSGSSAGAQGSSASAASSASASASETVSASAAAGQSTDELAAELKEAIANTPAFKSVTVTEEEGSADVGGAEDASASAASSQAAAEPEIIKAETVYKFDASGDKLKTSAVTEIGGVKLQYLTEGDDAVLVTDGPVYSGTVEQFDIDHAKGFEAFLASDIGDLNTLVDCAAEVETTGTDGFIVYMVTLDPEKYIESDEFLTVLAESGDPVKEANLSIGFEEDGSIATIDLVVFYEKGNIAERHLELTDYDSTVVDPMPAADRTYEEMEADVQAKLDAFEEQTGESEDVVEEASSSTSAEAK